MTRNKKKAVGCIAVGAGLMAFAFVDAAEAQLASFYGEELRGSPTASGEPFDPDGLTAAHPTLPLGSKVWVSNGANSIQVRINDRGPAAWTGKDIDLSAGAARALGIDGVGQVNIGSKDVSDEIKKPEPKSSTGITKLPNTGGIGG